MGKYLAEILILLGSLLILAGVYLVCPVATLFVGGILCVAAGAMVGYTRWKFAIARPKK
jgi:hypothetical protein